MTPLRVHDLMVLPLATIQSEAKMDDVMKAFERTEASFLPVLEGSSYCGFVSQTRLFDTYRSWLKDASIR